MTTANVAEIILDSGNDKLNKAMKQLADVRACKEKLQGKLMTAQGTLTKEQHTFCSVTEIRTLDHLQKDLNTSNPDNVRVCRQRNLT